MNDDEYTIKTGLLDVGDGHKIYYQQWGNKDANPIFFLHGGPGGSLKDGHKLNFNPELHHVIFHDQRGCGKSIPFGELKNNTTQDLVEDINKIAEHLKFNNKKITLYGGSWGSALALIYAVKHPKNVEKMLIYGVYTGTKKETDYIQQGGLKTHFPESWENYINIVPADKRNDTVKYYYDKIRDKNQEIADEHIRRWNTNESSAMSIDPDLANIKLNNQEVDDKARSVAIIECHFFVNNCFIPDKYIYDNAKKLSKIPILIVQGRHDHVCPPETAYELSKAIGNNCFLHITPGSHAREGAFREVIKAYTWSWLN
ncbi:prolyl aminopeptidase [Candidatus Saccharibacteria bacterium]|nr:prolyl aminopeptidase [Candidatus Saccharibacteria bacterium]